MLLIASLPCDAQYPTLYNRNYTSEHGLPSSEVHYCLQGPKGFMWIATDTGLSRFDGYGFKNYGPEEGLEDPVVFHLQLDSEGTLWMATLSGKLFYMVGDKIYAYHQNDLILNKMKRYNTLIRQFKIGVRDEFILNIQAVGILIIHKDGSITEIGDQSTNPHQLITKTSVGWMAGYVKNFDFIGDKKLNIVDTNNNIIKEIILVPKRQNSFLPGSAPVIKKIGMDSLLYQEGGNLYLLNNNKHTFIKSNNYRYEPKAFLSRNGKMLIGFNSNNGLRLFANYEKWEKNEYLEILKDVSVSSLFFDKNEALWVGTTEHGLFHFPFFNNSHPTQIKELEGENITAMSIIGEEHGYVGTGKGQLLSIDLKTSSYENIPLGPSSKFVYDLLWDPLRNNLWIASHPLSYSLTHGFLNKVHKKVNLGTPMIELGRKLYLSSDRKELWLSRGSSFAILPLSDNAPITHSVQFGMVGRFHVVYPGRSKVWAGKSSGLYEFKNDALIKPIPFFEAFNSRIEDIQQLKDSTLVLATRGRGVLLWKDSSLISITKDQGLSTDMIENIHVDDWDRIWAGTLQGLNRITLLDNALPIVQVFNTWHGLPSNEINMVRSRGEEVWIATSKGLHIWQEPEQNQSSRPPHFESILVNGKKVIYDSISTFDPFDNNLNFEFVSINYAQKGDIDYRYKLSSDDTWQYSKDRSINYANLSPGSYHFQVQSQNESGIWSNSVAYDFTIKQPFYMRSWFIALMLIALIGGLWTLYKVQTGRLKKDFALQTQMEDLEKQALRAQMKPHFIFNCLNSIQHLIMQDDSSGAMKYLSSFAKLVRGTLNSSVEGKITLDEEISILENYLQIEQLRFKDRFSYHIDVESGIDTYEITIPSFLLQPYVENAVIHGMSKKEEGGKISIRFYRNAEQSLIAQITDNGPGISASNRLHNERKSVGMMLTQRRLEILHRKKNGLVKIVELKDQDLVSGTQIEVQLT